MIIVNDLWLWNQLLIKSNIMSFFKLIPSSIECYLWHFEYHFDNTFGIFFFLFNFNLQWYNVKIIILVISIIYYSSLRENESARKGGWEEGIHLEFIFPSKMSPWKWCMMLTLWIPFHVKGFIFKSHYRFLFTLFSIEY